MNEEIQLQQPQAVETPPPAPVHPVKKKIPFWLLIGSIILVSILIIASQVRFAPEVVTPPPPTPIPTQKPSEIATVSAFMLWNQEVASLAAVLDGFNLADETVTVPILEVDLEL